MNIPVSEKARILFLGHSHLGAVKAAYDEKLGIDEISYEPCFYQFHREDRPHIVNLPGIGWRYNPTIVEEIIALHKQVHPIATVFSLQGEQAVAAGFEYPARPYKFYFPGEEDNAELTACEVVPFGLLSKVAERRFSLVPLFLDEVCSSIRGLLFALSPPPIIGDDDYVVQRARQSQGLSERLSQFGIMPSLWRKRMWQLHVHTLTRIYSSAQVTFLPPPIASSDESGFLKAKYWSDVFHANPEYGSLILKSIDEKILS